MLDQSNFNENLSKEQIQEAIDAAIASSEVWSEHPRYNTLENKDELVKRILYSSNPKRSLQFALAWFKYPYNKKTGIGISNFGAISYALSLLESFPINNKIFSEKLRVFFSSDPEINKFEDSRGFDVLKANQSAAMFILEAYVVYSGGWQTNDNGLTDPIVVIKGSNIGIVDGSQRMYINEAIRLGRLANMELDYWKFLKLITDPFARNSGSVDLSEIDTQIAMRTAR